MKKQCASIAVLFSAFFAASAIAAPDIAGVGVGAPLASYKALMQKANPQFQFQEIKTTSGKVAGIEGIAFDDKFKKYITDQFVALQDDEGVVWFVGRAVKMQNSSSYILRENFLSSLVEKYGPPTSGDPRASIALPTWLWDRNGNFLPKKKDDVCSSFYVRALDSMNISKLQNEGLVLTLPKTYQSTCGMMVDVSISAGGRIDGKELISGYAVQIIDVKRKFAEIERKKAATQSESQKKFEGVKENKPKL